MKIKWGILACGRIAKKFASDLNLVEGAELIAVASRSKEKAIEFAKEYPAKYTFGSYEELVSNPEVDVILPLNIAGPMFINVPDPDTIKDPVICTCEPDANIRFDLETSAVPLPTIKALCADDERLY